MLSKPRQSELAACPTPLQASIIHAFMMRAFGVKPQERLLTLDDRKDLLPNTLHVTPTIGAVGEIE